MVVLGGSGRPRWPFGQRDTAVAGSVAAADGKLLAVGTVATFAMPDDSEHTATITKVEPGKKRIIKKATREDAPF